MTVLPLPAWLSPLDLALVLVLIGLTAFCIVWFIARAVDYGAAHGVNDLPMVTIHVPHGRAFNRDNFQHSKGVMPSASNKKSMHLSAGLGRRSELPTCVSSASVTAGGRASSDNNTREFEDGDTRRHTVLAYRSQKGVH